MRNAKKSIRVTKQAVLAVSSNTFFYGCVLDDDQVPSPPLLLLLAFHPLFLWRGTQEDRYLPETTSRRPRVHGCMLLSTVQFVLLRAATPTAVGTAR
jgi:hypothetical protein